HRLDDQLGLDEGARPVHGGGHARAHGALTLRSQRNTTSLIRPIRPNTMSRANMVSTARKRWARTIWYARPSWAASSSATTNMSQAAARLMRATSMMPGTE